MPRLQSLTALIFVFAAVNTSHAVIPTGGYTSYLGGRAADYGTEHAYGIDVDDTGSAYVGGATQSQPFAAERRYGTTDNGGFVVKINPSGSQLLYSTYFDDVEILSVKLTPSNEVYALGHIGRSTQPFINLGIHGGGYTDAVLLKLDPAGALVWGRYIGGNDLEVPRALAVDAEGNAYIAGFTTSTNFPVISGAAQSTNAGGFDGFVAKIAPDGSMLYSTYIGGQSSENLLGLAVDSQRRAIVVGGSFSQSFGSTVLTHLGPEGGTDAFICRLNAQGSALEWATALGGSAGDTALAVSLASDGTIVLLGNTDSSDFPATNSPIQTNLLGPADMFLAKISANGQQLLSATYFGSTESEDVGDSFYFEFTLNGVYEQRSFSLETAGLDLGPADEIHIAARINSDNFPTAAAFTPGFSGSRDGYYARFNASLTQLMDFRFFGSASDDETRAIATDPSGNSYLAGTVYTPWLPPFLATTPAAFQREFGGSAMDGMVIKVPANTAVISNDSFAARQPLTGNRVTASTLIDNATVEPGEPSHGSATKSVWFTWRAPITGRLIASTAGSTFTPTVKVYSGNSLPTLSQEALGQTRLNLPIIEGVDYHFALVGNSTDTGLARLSLALSTALNDEFGAAVTLPIFPASTEESNIYATAQPGEPPHDDQLPSRSVWWKWVAQSAQTVLVSTEGSNFDTVLGIYTGDSLETLTRIASNDDAAFGTTTSEAVFLTESGVTYRIAVDGALDASGSVKLRILSNEPPPNDSFATRSNLTGTVVQLLGSNLRATLEPGEPRLTFTNLLGDVDANFGSATVWWSWTAPANGRLTVQTLGSDFDTRLAIYTGSALSNLTRLTASDDLAPQLGLRTSAVDLDVTAGREYFIQVDGSTDQPAGIAALNLRLTFPPRILPGTLRLTNDGAWQFQAEGVPGTNYRLETSTDLRTWSPFTAPSIETNGIWTFTLPPLNPSRAFIRLASIE